MTPAVDPPLRPGAVPDPDQPVGVDALLMHAEFLKRIARVLVGAGAAADDLVQETWLAALTHPPRARGTAAVRGWLARVARNAAAQERRGAGRRAAREEDAAVSEIVPDGLRAVEQLEITQRVVGRVLELEEPYRTTVVLRYLEDRPPREIARRMGVPIDTVHTRLRRALAELREALDADSGGDRSAWCAALAPLAGIDAATAVSVAAPAAGGALVGTLGPAGFAGALGMKLGLGLLAASAVGLAFLFRPDSEPRGAEVPAGALDPAVVLADPAPPLRSPQVQGIARDGRGGRTPAGGAQVVTPPTEVASTGPIERIGASPAVVYADGSVGGTVVLLDRDGEQIPEPSGKLTFGRREDHGGGTSVTVADGEFIALASLELDWTALEVVAAVLEGERAVPLQEPRITEAGVPFEFVLQVAPNWTLEVVDATTGQHLTGVEVQQARGWEAGVFCPTLTQGREPESVVRGAVSPLELRARIHRQRYWVRAQDHAWRRVTVDHDAHDRQRVELELAAALRVHIAEPIPPWTVELRLYPGGFEGADPVYAARYAVPEAAALFEDLPPGNYQVRAEIGEFTDPPLRFDSKEVRVAAGEVLDVELEIDMAAFGPAPAPLAGTLVLPPGLEDLDLQLQLKRAVGPTVRIGDRQTRGMPGFIAEGRVRISIPKLEPRQEPGHFGFDFREVTPGRVKFVLQPLMRTWVVELPEAGDRNVLLEVGDVARVELEVLDSVTRERLPVEHVLWSPFPAGSWEERATAEPGSRAERSITGSKQASIDRDERLASFIAPVGEVHVGFALDGYGESGVRLDVCAGEVNRVTAELSPQPLLVLGFRNAEGVLVEGGGFEIEPADGEGASELLRQASGRYIVTFDTPGTWRVTRAPQGWRIAGDALIVLRAGERVRHDVPVLPE